jgi:nitrite reductase/ring-hydroxylating ferredoxin subunit
MTHGVLPVRPGTHLADVLARMQTSLAEDLVPVEIFNDPDVFDVEMDRIFTNTWVFVAHETEIPNAGDFVQRRIGVDPVIVTRDGDGGINVLSNYCRHRGTQVCQTDAGNSRFFQCPYHGWTYANNGDLVGTPMMQRAYGQPLDKQQWGLLRAPRVESRQGFIFASLSEEVPSLEDYLGGAGWMLDLIAGLHPDGMRVVGPPDRYHVNADWKNAAENFAGDVYHLASLHQSVEEIHITAGLQGICEIGRAYEFENGHAFMGLDLAGLIPGTVLWGYPPEIKDNFELSAMSEAQNYVLNSGEPTVGNIFPNLSFIRIFAFSEVGGHMEVMTSFRQWQPIAPGRIELWSWVLDWKFRSDEDAARLLQIAQFNFGSAGIFEEDDTVAWEGPPRVARSPWAKKAGLQMHYQQGNESTIDQSPDLAWRGPGILRRTGYGEHNQLAFYRQWLQTMRGKVPATATHAE